MCAKCHSHPLDSASYSSISQVRAYNGIAYVNRLGTVRRDVGKIHPGDVARFNLDCDQGTIELAINGESKGVAFSGLKGLTIYPAAQAYSSGREIQVRGNSGANSPLDVRCL